MIDENNFETATLFDEHAYTRSQAAELALNEAILRADIARSYEGFLDIFERFYADDVEVSAEDSQETIRGKTQIRPVLLKFLVPLHVMAELAGLSISVQQSAVPRDAANQTHSAWTATFTGVSGKRCTLKWHALRRWNASRVVQEHHYDHQQIGGPLTGDDLNSGPGLGRVRTEFSGALRRK
jgi:hypothetical protein